MSTLFMYTTRDGTPTWRANKMCSRVCGIGPSAADTTRIAPSICAAPVDHVLDVVGMPGAVHVRVVALLRGAFHVAGRNRQNLGRVAPPLALRGLRNLVIRHKRRRPALLRRHLRQRRRQRRLAVVDVTDRPHVAMRLRAFEFLLRHSLLSVASRSVLPLDAPAPGADRQYPPGHAVK